MERSSDDQPVTLMGRHFIIVPGEEVAFVPRICDDKHAAAAARLVGLQAENARLRAALREIASAEWDGDTLEFIDGLRQKAREALGENDHA